MLLAWALRKITVSGHLVLIDTKGKTHEIGKPDESSVTVRLHDRALNRKLITNPYLHVGEAYMDGALTIEHGTLEQFLEFLCRNMQANIASGNRVMALNDWLRYRMRWFQQHNPVGRAQANVSHHYDLSGALYDLFLDHDRQYSCAYFTGEDDTLEQAQAAKKRHIAAKLLLAPGQRVLDIGCGWGGMGLYLAGTYGSDVTGVTLSEEQQKVAVARAGDAGLADTARFLLKDYREMTGPFDRIVSVGMFEHVGAGHFREFFAKVRDLMSEDGVMLLHSIGRMEPPGATNPWIRKYIFPGGYTPAMSEVLAAIEHEQLYVTDIEVLRLHYADTLRHWHDRFMANRDTIRELYDDRFCRMWEFYLKGCEVAFRHWNQMVFQIQIARKQDTVPLTRDYITDQDRAQEKTEGKRDGIAA